MRNNRNPSLCCNKPISKADRLILAWLCWVCECSLAIAMFPYLLISSKMKAVVYLYDKYVNVCGVFTGRYGIVARAFG